MIDNLGGDIGDLRRIVRLYEFAFDPSRLLSPTVLPDTYYPELLGFVGENTNTPYIILRQQAEYNKDRLEVLAAHNVDRVTADNVTSVHKSSSPMVQKLLATRTSYYSSDLEKEPNIGDQQRCFLLELGVCSAIYTPIFRGSELRAMIAYFRREADGFKRAELDYFTKSLAAVVELIYGFADRLYEFNNQMVGAFREANSLLAAFSSSFHEAKGYFSNPLSLLSSVRTDVDKAIEMPIDKRTMILEGLDVITENLLAARDLVYEPLQAQERPTEIPCLLELIKQAAQPLQRKFNDVSLRFISELPEPIPFFGREVHLKRLFFNLILNALQATRQALAETLISVGYVKITVGSSTPEGSLTVRIADNGIGIPEDLWSKVFERGFTTWRHEGGTGLGLYLARRTVQGEGGDLTIDSRAGGGTTVTVTLPIAKRSGTSIYTPTQE